MSFGTVTTFSKSRRLKPMSERKRLKKVGRKGEFWMFVSKILTAFFLKIELERRCEACDGTAYCGPITPAHSRRRQDVRVNDWYYALRVAVLGSDCHFHIDAKGRRDAEPIIENIITERFRKMGLSEERVKQILLECAEKIQADNPKYCEFLVTL